MRKLITICSLSIIALAAQSQNLKIAKLQYDGGGDWYANKTALPNLIAYCNDNLNMQLVQEEEVVDVSSNELFLYPYLYMTGHGNVVFSKNDAENLRTYLLAGGFLHIDDNYGLDQFIRLEMKKVFPELEFVEIPFTHPIYHQKYDFDKGLPKIHEHNGERPQGLGLLYEGRMVCFYTFESDLGNGWEDQHIYDDPEYIRQEALKMGANIISYCFTEE